MQVCAEIIFCDFMLLYLFKYVYFLETHDSAYQVGIVAGLHNFLSSGRSSLRDQGIPYLLRPMLLVCWRFPMCAKIVFFPRHYFRIKGEKGQVTSWLLSNIV